MPKILKVESEVVPVSFDPYWTTSDGETIKLYHGNVTDVLARLPEKSVHCVVTSPPYWGLRDYKAGDEEIGREETPDEFVTSMVNVFRGVRRVLRDDGIVWLNLGDSYGSNGNLVGVPWRVALALQADGWILRQDIIWHKPSPMPETVRNRCTKAHEYVFLLAKRQGYFYDAEAVKERADTADLPPRLLGNKQADTEYDGMVSHNENHASAVLNRVPNRNKRSVWTIASQGYAGAHFATFPPKLIEPMIKAGTSEKGCCAECGASWKRVVEEKTLTRERPNDYVKRVPSNTLARVEEGVHQGGVLTSTLGMNTCANSVAGVETKTVGWEPTCECNGKFVKQIIKESRHVIDSSSEKNNLRIEQKMHSTKSTLATFRSAVTHEEEVEKSVVKYVSNLSLDDHPIVPCVVLDPFMGSGTTACVSVALGRHAVGIDLNEKYIKNNQIPRIEGELLSRPETAKLIRRERKPLTGFKPVQPIRRNTKVG